MENAFGEPQTILLLGGTSEIGQAIVRRLVSPATRAVVLGCRRPADAAAFVAELDGLGVGSVQALRFDARDHAGHVAFVQGLAAQHGDLDVTIMAFGVLGDQATFDANPALAADAANVNYVGGVSAGLAVAERLRDQGHGRLVILSSVAGERVRKANFVYGSTKAGLDGFAQGLADSLHGSGASVLIVRPGFVHSRMTEGMKPAPFATTPEAVAAVTAHGLAKGRRIVWAPSTLRFVLSVMRHLPAWAWRRVPG